MEKTLTELLSRVLADSTGDLTLRFWEDLEPGERGRLMSGMAEVVRKLGLLGLHVGLEERDGIPHLVVSKLNGRVKEVAEDKTLEKSENRYEVAVASGFTGEICPACQSMRMQRNGTCSLCRDCG